MCGYNDCEYNIMFVCVRACMRACVCVCMRVCVHVCAYVDVYYMFYVTDKLLAIRPIVLRVIVYTLRIIQPEYYPLSAQVCNCSASRVTLAFCDIVFLLAFICTVLVNDNHH